MRIDRWPASVAWARILFAVFTNDNQNQGKLLIVADCGLPLTSPTNNLVRHRDHAAIFAICTLTFVPASLNCARTPGREVRCLF
jgi:hypothetical protein